MKQRLVYALFLGWRYTRSKRRNQFVSFIAMVSMLGIMLGVSVLIVVLSVMNGFEKELKNRILGAIPHVKISAQQPLSAWRLKQQKLIANNHVLAAAPLTEIQAMLAHNGHVAPAVINGIAPALEAQLNVVSGFFLKGALADLVAGEYSIILGDLLAAKIRARVGDAITMILPEATLSAVGVVPRLKRFRVTGVFSLGAELDEVVGYIHIADAAKLKRYREGQVQSLRLQVDDIFQAKKISIEAVNQLQGSYRIQDWTQQYGNLFKSIQMEKRLVGLLLFLIITVAAFNMLSTLVMTVNDKKSDIAILRTYGAPISFVIAVFVVQGTLVGLFGVGVGVGLGLVVANNISEVVAVIEQILQMQFLSTETYFISYFPSDVQSEDVIYIAAVSMTLCVLSTIYPAIRAAKVQPVEALRYA